MTMRINYHLKKLKNSAAYTIHAWTSSTDYHLFKIKRQNIQNKALIENGFYDFIDFRDYNFFSDEYKWNFNLLIEKR